MFEMLSQTAFLEYSVITAMPVHVQSTSIAVWRAPYLLTSGQRDICNFSIWFGNSPCNAYLNVYDLSMRYIWDEAKRKANLKKHGLDFADAEKVFVGPMVLFEDSRENYSEQRMIGIGLLDCLVVLIVHIEADETIRIISMRKADTDEIDLYYKNAGYF